MMTVSVSAGPDGGEPPDDGCGDECAADCAGVRHVELGLGEPSPSFVV
jgi:hypothetical protein